MLQGCSRISASVLAIVMLILPLKSQTPAPTIPAKADATGQWQGQWTTAEGWIFEADFKIVAADGSNITADIHWTLRQADPLRTDLRGKLGLTAVEHAKGTFDPQDGFLSLDGYAVEDPDRIIGLDKYRLVMSDDGSTIGGITWDHGDWNGQVIAKRVAK